jgi:hypothetical protein
MKTSGLEALRAAMVSGSARWEWWRMWTSVVAVDVSVVQV